MADDPFVVVVHFSVKRASSTIITLDCGVKNRVSHLGGSEMMTSYRAVRDCLGQRKKLMRSWYQIQKVTGLLTA